MLLKNRSRVLSAVSFASLAAAAQADVKLPALISDNMVLQQGTAANVWGTADPGEAITVKLGDKANAQVTAAQDGKWSVKLSDLPAGDAGDLVIGGKNTLTVKNVAVGEVWVASGQSNMEFTAKGAIHWAEESASANIPQIRMFTVSRVAKAAPQTECTGKWDVCTPQNTEHFSAVAYFFARHLWQNVKMPMGIIHTSWGGTPAEIWTPTELIQQDPAYASFVKDWEKAKANYPKAKEDYDAALAKWTEDDQKAKAEGTKSPAKPKAPRGGDDFGAPGCLYNGMIAPLLPYTIRGAIWYQGEANAGRAAQYERLFSTMIESWRERWNVGEFPFLFVQLANFQPRHDEPTDTDWARLREAQLQTLSVPHTGMALAIDIGEGGDIHPKNKQEVGRRLGLIAQATVYYQDTEYSGPIVGGAQEEEGKIRLTFRFSEGMKTSDGQKPKGFAIAGEDRKFVWADAEIQGDHVIVSSPQVPKPVAVRYAWADNPECNLVNEAGLPASPFRTDDWPKQ